LTVWDSLPRIQAGSRLREDFPLNLSPASLFEPPTVPKLSTSIFEKRAPVPGGEMSAALERAPASAD
jgi:hypothetical protein